jgi:hypothetical protein
LIANSNDELKKVGASDLPQDLGAGLLRAYSGLGTIHYHLACYECKMGNLELARVHLKQTFEIEEKFRVEALDDPVLKPLWDSLMAGRSS